MAVDIDALYEPFANILDMGTKLAQGVEKISSLNSDEVVIGASRKKEIASFDKVKLYHYESLIKGKPKTDPVLIVYGLVGRYTMIDLQEDRSLVRNLLLKGVDLYVIDWGYPSKADQFLNFDDYINFYMEACVNEICTIHNTEALTLFGICEGGVFTSIYAALYPDRVSNMILSITPIDFAADHKDDNQGHGFLNLWIRNLDEKDLENLIDAFGNLPGELMGAVFQAMTPIRSITKYNLDLLNTATDEKKLLNFLRMEKWLGDRPHHPGSAAKQWLIDLYKENKLVKGTFIIEDEAVDLGKISMPVLNIFAQNDHIIPPPCSSAIGNHIASKDYTEFSLPAGHVGIYVSSKLQGMVSEGIFDWLQQRQ